MLTILTYFSRDARAFRRTRAHLMEPFHFRHRVDVNLAMEAGVPIEVIVTLHDAGTESSDCTFADCAFNERVREMAAHVQAGGSAQDLNRWLARPDTNPATVQPEPSATAPWPFPCEPLALSARVTTRLQPVMVAA